MAQFDSEQIHYITACGTPGYIEALAAQSPLNIFTDLCANSVEQQLNKQYDLPPAVCDVMADLLHMLADVATGL